MFWGDAKLGRLEKSRINGSDRRVIYSNAGDRYYDIALSPHSLYVTDWTERSDILFLITREESLRNFIYHYNYIHVYSSEIPDSINTTINKTILVSE